MEPEELVRGMVSSAVKERKDKVVLVGNSFSIKNANLARLNEHCFTMGCNRGLKHFKTDILVISDRQPYWQELGRLRTYNGLIILSKTIFDPAVKCRLEPSAPKFDGSFLEIDVTTDGGFHAPSFDWKKKITSGPSVAIIMVQLAAMMGFRTIGLTGIDFVYNTQATHFWDGGRRFGAFPVNEHERTLKLLEMMGRETEKLGIVINNISTINGPVDKIFKHAAEADFIGSV